MALVLGQFIPHFPVFVHPLVKREVAKLPEALVAMHAWIGSPCRSCRMDLLMGCQLGWIAEALPAAVAGVRALPRVRAAVGCQLGRVAEAFGAIGAFVGPLRGVDPLVGGQLGAVSKALGA